MYTLTKYKFSGHHNFINCYRLKHENYINIDLEWAYQNKEILQNYFREAFKIFFPDEYDREIQEGKQEIQELHQTCGRGK